MVENENVSLTLRLVIVWLLERKYTAISITAVLNQGLFLSGVLFLITVSSVFPESSRGIKVHTCFDDQVYKVYLHHCLVQVSLLKVT